MSTATTTAALEQRTARLPRVRRAVNRARAIAELVIVWVEMWPAPLATAAVAAHHGSLTSPAVVGCAALTVAIWWRTWTSGALPKNVTDTLDTMVRLGWRNAELTTWQMPHLISVRTHRPVGPRAAVAGWRIEGRHSVPARSMELVLRPNDSQGAEAFLERVGDWCARRYGFEAVDVLPWHQSTNCISITLSSRSIPDHVGS